MVSYARTRKNGHSAEHNVSTGWAFMFQRTCAWRTCRTIPGGFRPLSSFELDYLAAGILQLSAGHSSLRGTIGSLATVVLLVLPRRRPVVTRRREGIVGIVSADHLADLRMEAKHTVVGGEIDGRASNIEREAAYRFKTSEHVKGKLYLLTYWWYVYRASLDRATGAGYRLAVQQPGRPYTNSRIARKTTRRADSRKVRNR